MSDSEASQGWEKLSIAETESPPPLEEEAKVEATEVEVEEGETGAGTETDGTEGAVEEVEEGTVAGVPARYLKKLPTDHCIPATRLRKADTSLWVPASLWVPPSSH